MCQSCLDIFSLALDKAKKCSCGLCAGKYIDMLNAVYTGNAVPIGFHNASLGQAIIYRPTSGNGKNFEAFVIPKETKSFRFIASNDADIAHILKWCRSHIMSIMSVDEIVDEVYHRCCVGGGDLTTKFLARNSPKQDLWDYVCAKDLLGQQLFE
jgi:hypothetical protein